MEVLQTQDFLTPIKYGEFIRQIYLTIYYYLPLIIQIIMLQRNKKVTVEEIVQMTREQLRQDFLALDNADFAALSPRQSLDLVLDMYADTSSPLFGTQIIREKLSSVKYPNYAQIDIILDKAEMLFLESFVQDLEKLKNEQKITNLNFEEVKQYVEEMNWKYGFQRQSVLNESQQIGENIDLMKFFEGVRNYQNQQQNLQKAALEKLKNIAHQTQKQLTFQKGYLISKISKIRENVCQRSQAAFMKKLKNYSLLQKRMMKFSKHYLRRVRYGFEKIMQKSYEISEEEILQQMFERMKAKKANKEVYQIFKSMHRKLTKTKLFYSILDKFLLGKRKTIGNQFFKQINTKTLKKVCLIQLGFQKLRTFTLRKSFKNFQLNIGLPLLKIANVAEKLNTQHLSSAFQNIKIHAEENKKSVVHISNKFKGRLLFALQKQQQKPINLRKTFLNWYLKGNEQKYTKEIYNIWLHGNISKLTFFMRMKNAIDQTKKYKVKQEMKVFLIVLSNNMNKYYESHRNRCLSIWYKKTIQTRRIVKMFKQLSLYVQETNQVLIKDAMRNIYEESQDNTFILRFINKYLGNYVSKVKKGIDEWKKIPSVKKKKGKVRLVKFLTRKLNEVDEQKKQVYLTLKWNRQVGRQIKRKVCSKVINHDEIYRQKFLQIWKHNIQLKKLKQREALLSIQSLTVRNKTEKTKQIIKFFLKNANKRDKQKRAVKSTFAQIQNENLKEKLSKTMNFFIENWKNGKNKKNKLVYNLVSSNKLKQAEVIYILKTRAQHMKKEDKVDRVSFLFEEVSKKVKKNLLLLYSKEKMFSVLSKILNNYTTNVHHSFKIIKTVPFRVDWKKRSKALTFHEKLLSLVKKQKNKCFSQFKYARHLGRFKMLKVMNIMEQKYFDVGKNNFNRYRKNVALIKSNEINKNLSTVFQSVFDVTKSHFEIMFMSESIWNLKAENLKKLNEKIRERMKQGFRLWHQSAKALSHFQKLNDEKKKRILQTLNGLLNRNQLSSTKKTIHLFKKNSNITKLQTHFLKKLCDSQAGKVVKAMMIWKNLPEQKNPELVRKATRFESNLSKYAYKTMKSSFQPFKNTHYFGNQKKKLAIRKLVARSASGIEGYFEKWKKNNELITLFKKCHQLQNMAQTIQGLQQRNYNLLFSGEETKKIQIAFNKIEKWWERKQFFYLQKLKEKTAQMKAFEQRKKRNLLNLSQLAQKKEKEKIHEFINKIKNKVFVKNILNKNFIQNRKNNFHKAMEIMKNLPDRIKVKKLKKMKAIIHRVEEEERKDKNLIFESFRSNKYQGNFKKNKAFEKFLREKIGRVHSILGNWNHTARKQKLEDKTKLVSSSFHSFNEIVRANLSQLLSSQKQLLVKKNALEKLYNIQESRFKGCLIAWKERARELQVSQRFENQKRKQIIEKLNKLVENSSDKNIKKSIKTFYTHFKIEKVQKKFIQRLLQTKSGKVVEAFNKWKEIPNQNLMEKYKNGQKFYFKLESFAKSKLLNTFKSFEDDQEEGNTIKKQSVLKLLDTTSNSTKKFYHRWMRITKKDITLMQVKGVLNWMESLHNETASLFQILFQDQKVYKIKVAAVQRLIEASGANAVAVLRLWRQKNQKLSVLEKMEGEKKKTALKVFNNALKNSEHGQVIQAIQLFNKNLRISKVSRNFFNKLLQTKSGKVVKLFQLWKSIPDMKFAVKKKKAIKFESKLHKVAIRIMKKGFDPFKNQSFEARNRKKYCLQKLVRASMGEQKKTFLRWRQINLESKVLGHSTLLESFFQNIQTKVQNDMNILFKDAGRESTKKKWLCRRLIDNSNFVQHHAYFIWKEAHQVDNIKIEKEESKVKILLKNMLTVHEKVSNKKALQIINAFKKRQNFKNSITSAALKEQKNKRIISIFNKLNDFVYKKKSTFLSEMKKDYQQIKILQRTVKLDSFFQQTEWAIKNNLQIMMRSNKDTIIMENALKQLFSNLSSSGEKVLNMWRQNTKILNLQERISNNKKKQLIEMISKIVSNNQSSQIPVIIRKFYHNYKLIARQKDILHKILHCKAGKVPLAFMLWKSLPDAGSKIMRQKAMKFQKGLYTFHSRPLKKSFQAFKDVFYEGNSKKRFAGNKLIMATLSDTNRYFNTWRKTTNEAKITDKLKLLNSCFVNSKKIIEENLMIFTHPSLENRKKVQAVRRIVSKGNENLSEIIAIWKHSAFEQKVNILCKALKRIQPQSSNKRLAKQCFEMIKKKKDLQLLRTYINSLWKWKLSNFEANYYSKFIKVFKQSQELIILSNCLNKKRYENLHNAFRSILSMSAHRQNRKTQITEKYLMRKYKNYFDIFKFNVHQQEIRLWRLKYKETVKGEKLMKSLANVIQNLNLEFFKKISKNRDYQVRVEKFDDRMKQFLRKQKIHGFRKMKENKIHQFSDIVSNVKNQSKERVLLHSFSLMKETSRMKYFLNLISKLDEKINLKNGFMKILIEGDKNVSKKLGIMFLSYVNAQVKKKKVFKIIDSFKSLSIKARSAKHIFNILNKEYGLNVGQFFKINKAVSENEILLRRFRRGMAVKKIFDKQDKKLLKNYLIRMKKKENPWVARSIRMFATHSSIKSSPAVSLWRMKAFQQSQQ